MYTDICICMHTDICICMYTDICICMYTDICLYISVFGNKMRIQIYSIELPNLCRIKTSNFYRYPSEHFKNLDNDA